MTEAGQPQIDLAQPVEEKEARLDGGMLEFSLDEFQRGKRAHPRAVAGRLACARAVRADARAAAAARVPPAQECSRRSARTRRASAATSRHRGRRSART